MTCSGIGGRGLFGSSVPLVGFGSITPSPRVLVAPNRSTVVVTGPNPFLTTHAPGDVTVHALRSFPKHQEKQDAVLVHSEVGHYLRWCAKVKHRSCIFTVKWPGRRVDFEQGEGGGGGGRAVFTTAVCRYCEQVGLPRNMVRWV